MKQESYNVVIVGAGVIGSAIAYSTAKAGLSVALLDKGRVAGEASLAAVGMVAPLDEDADPRHPVEQCYLTALQAYRHLDQQLRLVRSSQHLWGGYAVPFGLDLSAFDPDRFGGWG